MGPDLFVLVVHEELGGIGVEDPDELVVLIFGVKVFHFVGMWHIHDCGLGMENN